MNDHNESVVNGFLSPFNTHIFRTFTSEPPKLLGKIWVTHTKYISIIIMYTDQVTILFNTGSYAPCDTWWWQPQSNPHPRRQRILYIFTPGQRVQPICRSAWYLVAVAQKQGVTGAVPLHATWLILCIIHIFPCNFSVIWAKIVGIWWGGVQQHIHWCHYQCVQWYKSILNIYFPWNTIT